VLRFIRRTAHPKATGRTPNEFDASDLALVSGFCAHKGIGI